jgi:hypothetical protein
MTVLDPISGKQVMIDLPGKPRSPRGVLRPDEEALRHRQDTSIVCRPESDAGKGIQSRQRPDS